MPRIAWMVVAGAGALGLAQTVWGQAPGAAYDPRVRTAPQLLPAVWQEASPEPDLFRHSGPPRRLTPVQATIQVAHHAQAETLHAPLAPAPLGGCSSCNACDSCLVHPMFQLGPFFRYDALLFTVTRPDNAVVGNPAAEHFVVANGLPILLNNTLTTNWDELQVDVGHRFEFGWQGPAFGMIANIQWFDQSQGTGVGGARLVFDDPQGYMFGYRDANGDGIDDDINLNNIYGRNGQDLGTPNGNPPVFNPPFDGVIDQPAPTDLGDLVEYQAVFDEFFVQNKFEIFSSEVMGTYRVPYASWVGVDLFYGFRYIEMDDQYYLRGSGGALGASYWSTETENRIYGPQFGGRLFGGNDVLTISLEGRFLAGVNSQRAQLEGQIGGGINQSGQAGAPANLVSHSFNDYDDNTEFSPVGEIRLDTTWWAYPWLSFHVGYTGIIAGNVSRAVGRLEYTLPDFGLTADPGNDTIYLSALNLGVGIRR